LTEGTARKVADMMAGTVRYGTAYKGFHDGRGRGFLSGTKVAGKTGSLTRDTPYLSYSWFVGFAPADKPELVISVVLGNPPKCHLKAHTAARLVLESIF
jgi:cell division protein FtsI/penicillin-binding protein 2